jgi:hypothetical protein
VYLDTFGCLRSDLGPCTFLAGTFLQGAGKTFLKKEKEEVNFPKMKPKLTERAQIYLTIQYVQIFQSMP